MSVLMDFYAAESSAVTGYPVENYIAHVDFSIRMDTTDLEDLISDAASLVGLQMSSFSDQLTALTVNEVDDLSEVDWESFEPSPKVYLVSPEVRAVLAAIPDQEVEGLVRRWFASVARNRKYKSLTPTPEATDAVNSLVEVCRIADREGVDLIYTRSF